MCGKVQIVIYSYDVFIVNERYLQKILQGLCKQIEMLR